MKRLTIRFVLRLFLTPILSTAAHAGIAESCPHLKAEALSSCERAYEDGLARHEGPCGIIAWERFPRCHQPDEQCRIVDGDVVVCDKPQKQSSGGYPANVDQSSIEAWRRSRGGEQ